ncbi:MAG TPA: hypothetical protein DEH78_11015, partial [Solibacterales bacterium]|nr:hypothetical protein [Bryobacterales bacterium]
KRFHSERYAPLSRLLSQDDADLLIRSGIPVKAIRAFRAGRREVFRIYLRHLRADFSRLQQTGKLMILHSEVDRPDLAQALLRQNVAFRLALLRVESRLLLHALGLSGVDGDALLGPLESLSNAMYPFVSDSSMPTAA